MGRIVIVAYRPKPGRADALETLVLQHHEQLRAEGLVTDRPPVRARSEEGTVVEVFEWASAEAMQAAHENPAVQKMWTEFAEICEYIPIAQVPEAAKLFSELTPLS